MMKEKIVSKRIKINRKNPKNSKKVRKKEMMRRIPAKKVKLLFLSQKKRLFRVINS